MLKALLKLFAGAALCLVILEGTCRMLPVMSGWQNPPVSQDYPFVRNRPYQSYVYSSGWDFRHLGRGTFNSLGFSSPEPNEATNVVIVGDSYIEAAMLPQDRSIAPIMNSVGRGLHVVSFGRAGADVPDYGEVGDWIAKRYNPKFMIFMISEGDLLNSILPKRRGYWYHASSTGALTVKSDTQFGWRNGLLSSRLASYAIYNLKFGPSVLFPMLSNQEKTNRDTAPNYALLAKAAERFISDLESIQKSGTHIILAFDAKRFAIYNGETRVHTKDFELLAARARGKGITICDLSIAFKSDYKLFHRPFDFGVGEAHWNSYGSSVVADFLVSTIEELLNPAGFAGGSNF